MVWTFWGGMMTEESDSSIHDLNDALAKATDRRDFNAMEALVKKLQVMSDAKRVGKKPPTPIRQGGNGQESLVRSRVPGKPLKPAQRQARPAQPELSPNAYPSDWSDDFRAMPNELIRTGLFTIRRDEPRKVLSNSTIATLRNTMMMYSGEELRMKDEDVLMQAFHFQRDFKVGEPWSVNGRDFLKSMRWTDGKRGYFELYASLHRLSKGNITIMRRGEEASQFVLEAGAIFSHLKIVHGGQSGRTSITIVINPETRKLWDSLGYTKVNFEDRLKLTGSLSRYIHRFLSSHAKPYPYRVDTWRELTGSTASLNKFRQQIKEALQALIDIGFLSTFWIDSDDLVHVERTAYLEHNAKSALPD